jgi:hypothetical protein
MKFDGLGDISNMLVRKLQLWIIVDDFRGIAARFSNEH